MRFDQIKYNKLVCYNDSMCGRYTFEATTDVIRFKSRFHITNSFPQLKSNYNVAPTQDMPVVISNSPNKLVIMKWGIPPPWDPDHGKSLINARAETVFEKRTFKHLIETQRCLVLSTGFYEWQRTDKGKQPFFIRPSDQEMFAFAGIYKQIKTKAGETYDAYLILTTSPNEIMRPIHNRMPVILNRQEEDEWLNADLVEESQLKGFLKPYDAKKMTVYAVSTKVNNIRNNEPGLFRSTTGEVLT